MAVYSGIVGVVNISTHLTRRPLDRLVSHYYFLRLADFLSVL